VTLKDLWNNRLQPELFQWLSPGHQILFERRRRKLLESRKRL